MKIVITDGFTLNPGDLSWESISALGRVAYYDRTSADELLHRVLDANIIVTNKTPLHADLIARLPQLKMIAVTATGYNVVDLEAAHQRGIVVCNVPVYGTASVAQHAIALLLELTNRVGTNSRSVQEGHWYSATDWCYTSHPIMELAGKTLGIVGYGRIGRQTAAIGMALGMQILWHAPHPSNDPGYADMRSLFETADVISLHCPLTAQNKEFVDDALLRLMKPSALLINTSRGALICETDLAAALRENRIAGAALDVLSAEPPLPDHPLIGLPNCLVTPHNAWLSVEARRRILNTTAENIAAWQADHAIHVVR